MKTTDWFPMNVNPVREGVYQVKHFGTTYPHYSRWYKGYWREAWGSAANAANEMATSPGVYDYGSYTGRRGVAPINQLLADYWPDKHEVLPDECAVTTAMENEA